MRYYQWRIRTLRQYAEEHENDKTQTAHIIVSDLCKDTASLLNALEQEPTLRDVRIKIEKRKNYIQSEYNRNLTSSTFDLECAYNIDMIDGMNEALKILDKYETSFKPWNKTVERLLKSERWKINAYSN